MDWQLIISKLIIFLYAGALVFLFFYSLVVLSLTLNFKKSIKKQKKRKVFSEDFVPNVTVQLPLYNEKYVVERLLKSISELDYPLHKFEIQVLDDSTDDSVELTKQLVEKIKQQGIDIKYIHRTDRQGFKAGALKEGLAVAKGEFIAIFDADFLPPKDWIKKTIPYFDDEKIGLIQTRWGHINKSHSVLTKIQAFALDAHFTLEQLGRNSASHFINFNGTAGMWRKQCILDAGNWESDTLTEDLDLSYRAQLKHWKFKYLVDVETPAELPAVVSAVRSQQFRWNKGGAENLNKNLWKILKAKDIPFGTKLHSIFHLMNSSIFLLVLIMGILSVPILFIKNHYGHLEIYFQVFAFLFITTIIFFYCYWQTYKYLQGKSLKDFFSYSWVFIQFYSLAMGLSFNNSVAVVEGLIGKRSAFIRTPKFNMINNTDECKNNVYLSKKINKNVIVEILLAIYFIFGIVCAFIVGDYALAPFHLLLTIGFGYIIYHSIFKK